MSRARRNETRAALLSQLAFKVGTSGGGVFVLRHEEERADSKKVGLTDEKQDVAGSGSQIGC